MQHRHDAPDFGGADHHERTLGLVEVPEDVLALLLRQRAVQPAVLEALPREHALEEIEEAGEAAAVSASRGRTTTHLLKTTANAFSSCSRVLRRY